MKLEKLLVTTFMFTSLLIAVNLYGERRRWFLVRSVEAWVEVNISWQLWGTVSLARLNKTLVLNVLKLNSGSAGSSKFRNMCSTYFTEQQLLGTLFCVQLELEVPVWNVCESRGFKTVFLFEHWHSDSLFMLSLVLDVRLSLGLTVW